MDGQMKGELDGKHKASQAAQEECRCWNTWQAKHRERRPDYSRANLATANLSGAHPDHTNFHGANLEKVALERTDLRGGKLEQC